MLSTMVAIDFEWSNQKKTFFPDQKKHFNSPVFLFLNKRKHFNLWTFLSPLSIAISLSSSLVNASNKKWESVIYQHFPLSHFWQLKQAKKFSLWLLSFKQYSFPKIIVLNKDKKTVLDFYHYPIEKYVCHQISWYLSVILIL